MPMDNNQITATATKVLQANATHKVEVVFLPAIVFSFVALVAAVFLSIRKKTLLGPETGRLFNQVTLTVGVFASAVLFTLSVSTHDELPIPIMIIAKLMDAFKMMLPGFNVVSIADTNLGGWHVPIVFYEHLLYLVAPVATIVNILMLFKESISRIMLRCKSSRRDTYLITPLNEETLALATSIRKKYEDEGGSSGFTRKANVVFTDCNRDMSAALTNSAYDLGAVCVSQSTEEALGKVSRKHDVRVLFDGGDVSEIARAKAMYEDKLYHSFKEKLNIYLFSPLVSAGEMLPDQSENSKAFIGRVDWVSSLVESTLNHQPLFLLNPSPRMAADYASMHPGAKTLPLASKYALGLQEEMLKADSRRIVIVGAGHVGIEFLKMALVYSNVAGMSFSFDVIDNTPDPTDPSQCIARSLVQASAPELLNDEDTSASGTNVKFLCLDVRTPAYEEHMVKNASSITYVFVALGNDAMTADTAMRTRKMLERGILKDCMKADGLRRQKHVYDTRCRPVIVAVIDDDGLGETLSSAASKNLSQSIQVVGSRKSMFSFESLLLADRRDTDYKSRSAHLSKEHAKYKVFAYARHMELEFAEEASSCSSLVEKIPDWRLVDWREDFRTALKELKEGNVHSATLRFLERYNDYCEKTPMFASEGEQNHEWLLRMEHDRWRDFAHVEGFRMPTHDEARVYMSVFPDGDNDGRISAHRSDETGLHAGLAPFDDLPDIDDVIIEETYANREVYKSLQQKNDEHIRVEKRN